MANRIPNKIKKLEAIRDNLNKDALFVLSKYEKEIIRLNTSQFEQGKGSDGQTLRNSNPFFKGRYSIYTQTIAKNTAAPKNAGDLYNFAWTGDFLSGMYVDFKPVMKYSVFSNGMGAGDKLSFFKGYTNLFGLNDDSMKKLRALILPELKEYLKRRL